MPDAAVPPDPRSRLERFLLLVLVFFAVQSVYLAAYATPDLFYPANVLAHAFGGAALLLPFAVWARRRFVRERRDAGGRRLLGLVGALLLAVSAAFALALMVIGNTRPHRWLLHVHIATAVPATLALLAYAALRLRAAEPSPARRAALATLLAALVAAPWLLSFRLAEDDEAYRIQNPPLPPRTMDQEAMAGREGPFFPSSAETSTRGRIPSTFFMTSKTCGQQACHPDIYAQWQSSMHRFSSFNNQWYRKSIEYMQSVAGVEPSKWCAGCHDLAVLFNGMFDRPATELIDTPEAQVGLACTACHSITRVKSTMGQGDYTIEYPPLHDLAVSENPILKGVHDAFVRLDPEPHAKTFLKPFHREQHGDFCSACHKVHLDKPVNNYRWFRGFNDYDNWQASGVSGMGARSFYYPPAAKDCVSCHMPMVASSDKGNRDGKVHSHRFPAANTAVPFVNGDAVQLEAVQAFLRKQVTVDIFALEREAPGAAAAVTAAAAGEGPRLASTFAVGEEGGSLGSGGFLRAGPIQVTAPIDRERPRVAPGESVRIDVVVRTRGVGHFFPGGTVDAFDVWVEMKAEDARGVPIFWSGRVEDRGKGPVEPAAHFYRALMIDEHGNEINKRNAWSARSVVYVRLIPPGAADTVHYRLQVPADVVGPIKLTARLNHRKFSYYNTRWAYAGVPDPGHAGASVTKDHDDRPFVFTGDTARVSGKMKAIPDLPTTEIDAAQAWLGVEGAGDAPPLRDEAEHLAPNLRERWNDYGIGLLLQGDLRAALHAFEKVTEIEPGYLDGWVNIARTRLREGDTARARAALERVLAVDPTLGRARYFAGVAAKTEGDYDASLLHLMQAHTGYPKDRVVLNEIARVHFLRRDFRAAVEWAGKVMAIDPEDLNAHYTLMLAWKGLGDAAKTALHEEYYRRFKADEDAQILTGDYRRTNPHDNNERQPIHEHGTADLGSGS